MCNGLAWVWIKIHILRWKNDLFCQVNRNIRSMDLKINAMSHFVSTKHLGQMIRLKRTLLKTGSQNPMSYVNLPSHNLHLFINRCSVCGCSMSLDKWIVAVNFVWIWSNYLWLNSMKIALHIKQFQLWMCIFYHFDFGNSTNPPNTHSITINIVTTTEFNCKSCQNFFISILAGTSANCQVPSRLFVAVL